MLPHIPSMEPRCRAVNEESPAFRRGECQIDMKAYIAKALKLAEYGEIWEVTHPLPILTAVGNGDNGGDYHGNHQELVGTWADDVISSEDEIPEGCSAFGTIFFARI